MVGDRVATHSLDLLVLVPLLSQLILVAFELLQHIAVVFNEALEELLLLLVSLDNRIEVLLLGRLYHLTRDCFFCHLFLYY